MKPGIRQYQLHGTLVLLAFVLSNAGRALAAEPAGQVAYFVDEQMQSSAGACELTVLRSYDQISAALFQGGTGNSCEVMRSHVSDCLIRCGEHRRFTTTTYKVRKGVTAVLVVYNTPNLLSAEIDDSPGKFDADYEKRALYAAGRRELREYWLALSVSARRQVKRAYALLLAPAGGRVQQVETWFE